MKGLIIGDFSSLGKELRKGFLKNEIDVDLISSGDYWKKIKGGSIDLNYNSKNFISKIFIGIKNRVFLKKFVHSNRKKYDFILIMNLGMINFSEIRKFFKLTFTLKEILTLSKSKKNIYLLAAGIDKYYLEYGKVFLNNSGYFTLSKKEIEDLKKINILKKRDEEILLKSITGIIPIMYEYSELYRYSIWMKKGKLKETIPLCIDINNFKINNSIKDKIIIFHGISRSQEKGTEYIKKAMENIKNKYPEKVEILFIEKVPFKDYLKIISKVNILIDQCKSHSYGMNALYGMAMGKVVFSGNDLKNEIEFNEKNIPVVNIIPNVSYIEKQLEYYILNPDLIIEKGNASRKFVEKIHNNKIVAAKYINLFKKELINEKQ